MKSLCFLSTLGILYFSSVIQNVKSLEPCREGFTPQKCCSYNFVQENGQRKCNLMIPESTYLIYAADTLYLNCDPGFDGGSSGCSWRLPSGESCTFLATDLLPNSKVCSADSSITLTSNLSLGICNIMVANVQYKHEGNWSCSVTASSKYFDNTYVEISNGMKTSTILAITIPVSLLVIAIVSAVLVCCFCPALCASCACITACCSKKEKSERRSSTDSDIKTTAQVLNTPPSPPPRPPTMIQPIIRIQRNMGPFNETHYDTPSSVSSYENTSTVGAKFPSSNSMDESEPVLYTTLNPQGDESGSMQTARKVSNAISVHSFGPRKPSKFKDVHF